MCGIAGIILKNFDEINKSDLQFMTDKIAHRGPDGEGHYLYENLGLGHRRLAILDLSENGHQPMIDRNIILTYNGEVYNYLEIKEELKELGHKFKTDSDTEVIINAYKEWSTDCVLKFNGMWAFALFDKTKKELFVSRDRFGIKPFYYINNDKGFYFGSEIKQLIKFLPEIKVNREVLFDFLYFSYQHHNTETFFKGIVSMPAGHNLIYNLNENKFIITQYYDLLKPKMIDTDINSCIELYKKEFNSAINLRLRSDVKVGTCLSGGLDSSYVAKVASEKYKGKLTAITGQSIDKKNDETKYARIVAEKYGLEMRVIAPNKKDFFNVLDDVIYIQEEPFGSPSIIMQYFVMKKAKEKGCIVMLDGQGGDETMLGYERYYVPFLKSIKNPFKRIKLFKQLSNNSKLSLKELFSYYVYFSMPFIRNHILKNRGNYILKENKKYFNFSISSNFNRESKNLFHLQKNEITKIQLQKLLKFEDRNSMAHSIEARIPFIDYKLLELALSIPAEFKIKDGWSKYILRRCFGENAPKEIVWRKNKFGFEAPSDKWMENKEFFIDEIKSSTFLSQIIDKEKINKDFDNHTIWKLYNISKWAVKFNVKF